MPSVALAAEGEMAVEPWDSEGVRSRGSVRMRGPGTHASRRWTAHGALLVAAVVTLGCTGAVDTGPSGPRGTDRTRPVDPPVFVPTPATLHRMTRAEHDATLRALLGDGYALPTDLPADTPLHGFSTVGGSELSIAARDAEQYEAAAMMIAEQTTTPERRLAFYGCDVAAEGAACIESFVDDFGQRAWRRPLTSGERASLVALHAEVLPFTRDAWVAAGFVTSAILQSPHFLFRVEIGEDDPEDDTRLRYTSWEMASRLSYFLWGAPPDDALLAAAARGELVSEDAVRREAIRMLADPRARTQMVRFFAEFLALDRLAEVEKNAELFPEWNATLRDSMRIELEELLGDVWDRDADVREILSTDSTYVDSALAALYGLADPGEGMRVRTTLPESAHRGGLLGRAGILAMYSHATITSPVLRGKFVLINVLCEDIPPPPPGIPELEEAPEGEMRTIRQQLERHRADPVCAGCHDRIDPPGLALEHFDPIGRYRTLDHGLPVDASWAMMGGEGSGADELGTLLASSDQVGACFARRLYRFGTGHLETRGELPGVRALEDEAAEGGYRLRAIAVAMVTSEGFRYASFPDSECVHGESRECTNACGSGVETCAGGRWTGCTAPAGVPETCNGADDDCDGAMDEALMRECSGGCGAGTEMCVAGAWGGYTAREPGAESCNRVDDDCDGTTDEGFGAVSYTGSYSVLRGFDPSCDGVASRLGEACNRAIDGVCSMSATTCGTSGFGPVENSGDVAAYTCVAATRVDTSYTELASQHAGCNGTSQRIGPECNAAISRLCASRGMSTGYGPVRVSGSVVTVACVPGAEVVETTYTTLSSHHGPCTAASRIGGDCNAAIHRFCISRGAVSGFGPLENSGDVAVVACVRP